ncbi:MAG TPA: four helix bundle protein [Acidobacteriaceae bacterium]|nr:four helix bundle protein [Acidobacteriaceae bacterium]
MTKVHGYRLCPLQSHWPRISIDFMDTRRFRDLQVWQRSMTLARNVYAATEGFPKSELFGLSSQIRRAAVSVPSNIAEGRGRMTDKSFALFLSQARGSLYELQTQVELAGDLGFVDKRQAEEIIAEAAATASMIHALLATLRMSV